MPLGIIAKIGLPLMIASCMGPPLQTWVDDKKRIFMPRRETTGFNWFSGFLLKSLLAIPFITLGIVGTTSLLFALIWAHVGGFSS